MKNVTITFQVDEDNLPFAREGVLRAWSEAMGVAFNPDYLDDELTYDEELGHDHTIVGLVDAHNLLLHIQYTLDNNGIDPSLELALDSIKVHGDKLLKYHEETQE